MDIKEEIHALSEEMLTNLGRLVAIDSQLGTPSEGKPFGEGPAKALEEGLKIAEELGFKTVNLDNYCGYAEMGEGDEIVGIAGHLDIVPVGGDWTYDPFRLTREDDHVYGRGTTDDKGPILEALYAMKLLRDHGVKLNKRVRLIMGCNEETGSRCMDHYNQVAEELSCGFTPDASFPCIHGEKGQLAMIACSKNTRIISMNGGFVSNAMCDTCTTVVPDEDGLKEKLESALSRTKLQEYKVTEENGELTIYAKGIPAHASTPHLGVNAAGVTFECLAKAGFEDDFVEFEVKSYHLKVTSDELTVENDFIYGMISNSRSVGGFKNLTGKNVDMNDGLFEVTLITNPKNPLELQEIMTALLTAEDNTDLIYSFKSAHVVIESEEAVPWTLDGEFGGDQTRVEIDNLHEAMNLYLTSSKKQKKSRLNQKMQEIKEITQKSEE